MRVLVDTNVFLDLLLKREPFFEDGFEFINKCRRERHEIYVNAMQFRDIEYIIRKHTDNQKTYDMLINGVYGIVTKVIPLTADDAINAIFEPGKDFEDTLLANSAETAGIQSIVSSNAKDFYPTNIRAFTLKEFNQLKPSKHYLNGEW